MFNGSLVSRIWVERAIGTKQGDVEFRLALCIAALPDSCAKSSDGVEGFRVPVKKEEVSLVAMRSH